MTEANAKFLCHIIRYVQDLRELEDHCKVFDLLPVEKELGMKLSPAYQLIPEQSTAAIIIHHKDAEYYSTSESRVK
jgi:5-methyltetrahydrofolate--homocysteine methyltransferase